MGQKSIHTKYTVKLNAVILVYQLLICTSYAQFLSRLKLVTYYKFRDITITSYTNIFFLINELNKSFTQISC